MADGLARAGFDLDLRFGEARETAFVETLLDCHVECKSDQKHRLTGNLFIETHQRSNANAAWRKSGINVTTARWWAIEYADDAWLVIRTSLLLQFVARAEPKTGGDNNNFLGRLVPVRWLYQPLEEASKHRLGEGAK